MKVAVVHDDLVQWGGAERVLLAILELIPNAPVFTSVFDKENPILVQKLKDKRIITSFMQKIPGWRRLYKGLLPLYPIAFEQFDFSEYDLVISQTTRFAKSIITKPTTKHVCLMHTPPRFLWNFSGETHTRLINPYFSYLRIFDRISSYSRIDKFIAGSKNASERIRKIYKKDSLVLQPFVDDVFLDFEETFDGGYYLIISRLNQYKGIELVIKTFNKLGKRLKVVGKGPQEDYLKSIALENIEFLKDLPEDLLVRVIAGARGLVVSAEEDFGLTALEAQALGKGVIAFGKGGIKETVIEGKTGVFYFEKTEEALEEAVRQFEGKKVSAEDCKSNARRFNKQRFLKEFKELVGFF